MTPQEKAQAAVAEGDLTVAVFKFGIKSFEDAEALRDAGFPVRRINEVMGIYGVHIEAPEGHTVMTHWWQYPPYSARRLLDTKDMDEAMQKALYREHPERYCGPEWMIEDLEDA